MKIYFKIFCIIIVTISLSSCYDKPSSDFYDSFESKELLSLINNNPKEAIKLISIKQTQSDNNTDFFLGEYYKSLAYRYISTDSALLYANKSLSYFLKNDHSPSLNYQISRIYNDISCLYGDMYLNDSVTYFSDLAYKYLKKSNQLPDYLISYGFNLINVHNTNHNYSKSIQLAKEILFKADSLNINEKNKTPIYLAMANTCSSINNWQEADSLLKIVDNHYDELDWRNKKFFLNIKEKIASLKDDTKELMFYSKQEYNLLSQIEKENEAVQYDLLYCELNIAQSYAQESTDNQQNIDSAFYYLNFCKNSVLYETDASFHAQVTVIETFLYYSMNEYDKAVEIIEDSTNIKYFSKSEPSVRKNLLEIGNFVYNRYGEYEKAKMLYYERFNLNDSILKAEIATQINSLSDKYQQNIKLLSLENENEHFKFNIAILIASLVILLTLLFYLKKKKDSMLEKSRNKLALIKLESVRSRIAPHFILNVLNRNIAHRRNNDGIDETEDLIHILHSNLELVKKDIVSLREELDFIKLYIKLESNGLGLNFYPLIEVGANLDADKILIPSMMLQIFVENAIKHGLRTKEGNKYLWMNINEIENGNHKKVIRYVITDNGGGFRVGGGKIKDSTHTGMLIIRETVMYFNAKNKQKINYLINTVDVNDGEKGCRITLDIPVGYRFVVGEKTNG